MFASPSADGQELATAVEALGARLGLAVTLITEPTRQSFAEAVFTATVVVIDGTLETENAPLYPAASVVLSPFLHTLIVGRTYLPLNFVAQRKGGAAPYPYGAATGDDPPFQRIPVAWRNSHLIDWERDPVNLWMQEGIRSGEEGQWGNEDIVRWLRVQIPEVLAAPGPRLTVEEYRERFLAGDGGALRPVFEDATSRLDEAKTHAFISYRSFQFRSALRLGRDLLAGRYHDGPKQPIVVKPGALALDKELLTEVRRWMIMGLLDDEMRRSDEFWIVESTNRDCPYRGSWWTTAELYAAAYVAETPEAQIRIRIWNPRTGAVRDDDGRYRIELSDAHRRRMARLLSNTRPDQISPENRTPMRLMRFGFRVGLGGWLSRRMGAFAGEYREALASQLPSNIPAGDVDLSQITDRDALRAYVNDRVFSDEFWEDLYIEPQRVSHDDGEYCPSPEAFINSPQQAMLHIRASEAAASVRKDRVARVENGSERLRLVQAPPRYLWSPPRGAFPGRLHELPTYVVINTPPSQCAEETA
jgi:hypothetical protein